MKVNLSSKPLIKRRMIPLSFIFLLTVVLFATNSSSSAEKALAAGSDYFEISSTYSMPAPYGVDGGTSWDATGPNAFDSDTSPTVAVRIDFDYTGFDESEKIFSPGEVTITIPKLMGLTPSLPDLEQSGFTYVGEDAQGNLLFENIIQIGPGDEGFFTLEYHFNTADDTVQKIVDPNDNDTYRQTFAATINYTDNEGIPFSVVSNPDDFALQLIRDDFTITKLVDTDLQIPEDLPTFIDPSQENMDNYYYIPYTVQIDQTAHSLHAPFLVFSDQIPQGVGAELLQVSQGDTIIYSNGVAVDPGFAFDAGSGTMTYSTDQYGMYARFLIWIRIPKAQITEENKMVVNNADMSGDYNNIIPPDPDEPSIHGHDDATTDAMTHAYDGGGANGEDGSTYRIGKSFFKLDSTTYLDTKDISQTMMKTHDQPIRAQVWLTKSLSSAAGSSVDAVLVDDFMDNAPRQDALGNIVWDQQDDSAFYYSTISVYGNENKIGGKDFQIWVRRAGDAPLAYTLLDSGQLATTPGADNLLYTYNDSANNIVAVELVVKGVSDSLLKDELELQMDGMLTKSDFYAENDITLLKNAAYMNVLDHATGNSILEEPTSDDYNAWADQQWKDFGMDRDENIYGHLVWRATDDLKLNKEVIKPYFWKGVNPWGSQWAYNVDEGCFKLDYYLQFSLYSGSDPARNFSLVDILPEGVTFDSETVHLEYRGYFSGDYVYPAYTPPTASDNAFTQEGTGDQTVLIQELSPSDYEVIDNYQGSGRTALIVRLTSDPNNPNQALFMGQEAVLGYTACCYDYDALLGEQAFCTTTNQSAVVLDDWDSNDSTTTIENVYFTDNGAAYAGFPDLDQDGKQNEYILPNDASNQLNRDFTAGVTGVVKLVTTDHNRLYTKKGTASLGSDYDYRFNINAYTGSLRNVVVYDTLPFAGDTFYKPGASGQPVPRNSEWAGSFLGIDLGNAGSYFSDSKIYYSTKTDPGKLATAPGDWVLSTDYDPIQLSQVKSFCIDLGTGVLPKSETVILTVHMRAPSDIDLAGKQAVNTFYYDSEILNTESQWVAQITNETNYVTVLLENPPMIIGDTVFRDKDDNGMQDADEFGIEGVSVHLYMVDDVNGTIDHDGHKLVEVATTMTDANGKYYFFPELEGSYYVKVDQPPVGYKRFSDPILTNDDESRQWNKADQDGWLAGITMDTLVNNRNLNQDAGLIPDFDNPGPPHIDKTVNDTDSVTLISRDEIYHYKVTYDFTNVDTSEYLKVTFSDDLNTVFDQSGAVSSAQVMEFIVGTAKIIDITDQGNPQDVTATLGAFYTIEPDKLVYVISDPAVIDAMPDKVYQLQVDGQILETATDDQLALFIDGLGIPNQGALQVNDQPFMYTDPVFVVPPGSGGEEPPGQTPPGTPSGGKGYPMTKTGDMMLATAVLIFLFVALIGVSSFVHAKRKVSSK